jgi:hypothetical protein
MLAISTVMGISSVAMAHPGHDPFDAVPETAAKGKMQKRAVGPVIFTSVQNIEQSSSMEIWAGLRFKAYYHLTITGVRNNQTNQIKRTFTFEVANETKDRKRARRGFAAKGSISAKTYVRKITVCRNLAERAMSNPAQYDFRVENRGRSGAACRLINIKKSKPKLNPDADAPAVIAKRNVKSHKGSV